MYGLLCRDGIFGNLNIKGKNVLDKHANLNAKNATFRGDVNIKKDLVVCGDVEIKGELNVVKQSADYIVIGSGAAGSVVASRLAQKGYSVLVLEAGPDVSPESQQVGVENDIESVKRQLTTTTPIFQGNTFVDVEYAPNRLFPSMTDRIRLDFSNGLTKPSFVPSNTLLEFLSDHQNGAYYPYVRSSGAGGSTNHHNGQDSTGSLEIYDSIGTAIGNTTRWNASEAKRIFEKMHDNSGWLKTEESVPDYFLSGNIIGSAAMLPNIAAPVVDFGNLEAAAGVGIPRVQVDYLIDPVTQLPGDTKVSYSYIDLLEPTQQDPNAGTIDVKFNTLVDRIVLEESSETPGTFTGTFVEAYQKPYLQDVSPGGAIIAAPTSVLPFGYAKYPNKNLPEKVVFKANKEIIVCGGAILSPSILMRSGIGKKEMLEPLGIDCKLDKQGVGKDIMDHTETFLMHQLDPFKYLPGWQALLLLTTFGVIIAPPSPLAHPTGLPYVDITGLLNRVHSGVISTIINTTGIFPLQDAINILSIFLGPLPPAPANAYALPLPLVPGPGASEAFIDGYITGTTLTVASLLPGGAVYAGQQLWGPGISLGTQIVSQDSGTPGGVGTYTVSIAQTVPVGPPGFPGFPGYPPTINIVALGEKFKKWAAAFGQLLGNTGCVQLDWYADASNTPVPGFGHDVHSVFYTAFLPYGWYQNVIQPFITNDPHIHSIDDRWPKLGEQNTYNLPYGVGGEPPGPGYPIVPTAGGRWLTNLQAFPWLAPQVFGDGTGTEVVPPIPDMTEPNPKYVPSVFVAWLVENLVPGNTNGTVKLRDADPRSEPIIDLRLYEDDDGVTRIAKLIIKLREIMDNVMSNDPNVAGLEIFPGANLDKLDNSGPDGINNNLVEFIKKWSPYGHHISGGCQMGASDTGNAVCDSEMKVYGTTNVRVCDTSVYPPPYIHGGNTARAAYLVAEILGEILTE